MTQKGKAQEDLRKKIEQVLAAQNAAVAKQINSERREVKRK